MSIHQQKPAQLLWEPATSQRASLLLACGALAAVLSSNAPAQSSLNAIGGGGGGGFDAPCAATELLTGFELRTGDYVDALRPLCVTATGPNQIGAASDSAWHGGTGGGLTRIVCPGDKPVVNGLFVGTDSSEGVVNNLLLYCNVAAGTKPSGDSTSSFARPGPDGSISATHDDVQGCPDGQVAVGAHGRSGRYVDAVGLICDAPRLASSASDRPVVKSIGRVSPPATGPKKPICDAARDARARNSPAAPNLEAQCQASKQTVTSIGRIKPGAPIPAEAASPVSPETQAPPPPPSSSSSEPAADPSASKHAARDAAIQSLIGSLVSSINASRRDDLDRRSPVGTSIDGRADVDRNERRHDPVTRSGQGAIQVDPGAAMHEPSQPENSIRVEVRYPAAYGYKDATGIFDPYPNSCAAFYISALPAAGVRPREPTRIDTQPRMRNSNDMYVCEYLIRDQPLDAPVIVRVAMSDQRAAGSEAWLGGSQTLPPAGQRRTIADGDRQVVLTASQSRAALRFEMAYAGSR